MSNARELAELGGSYGQGGFVGMKNRIINGAMVIDQRNAGAAITVQGFGVDRFVTMNQCDGVVSSQQVSDGPTGFDKSLKVTVTTADASLGTIQYVEVRQLIEGFNVADFGWGASGASTVTLSFWVKSSLTGTFGGSLINTYVNRSYPFGYTISSANTWEYKTVTVPGDTTGTWLKDNNTGMYVILNLGCGTNYQGTAGSWAASRAQTVTGAVSLIGTLNATWQVTGVQLEKGSTATSFDYRPYGTELALCQRYYYKYLNNSGGQKYLCMAQAQSSTSAFGAILQLPVPMRSTPSTGYSAAGDFGAYNGSGSAVNYFTSWSITAQSNILLEQDSSGGSGLVAGNAAAIIIKNNGYFEASSEL